MYIADEDKLLEFVPTLADTIRQKSQCAYVHCWGGHGRTGVIIAIILAVLYDIDAENALELTEAFHSKRVICKSQSPQTEAQFEQVRRAVKALQTNKSKTN